MPRLTQPFIIYSRKLKSGRICYYYKARDPDTGEQTQPKSTGCNTKTAAYAYCLDLMRKGKLISGEDKPQTLEEWVFKNHFFEWTDTQVLCPYCRDALDHSPADKPRVQRPYADKCYSILYKDILPLIGDKKIKNLKWQDIDQMCQSWHSRGLAPKTINNKISVLRLVLNFAVKTGAIEKNPAENLTPFYCPETKRGRLSIEEYKQLMDPGNFSAYWKNNLVYYTANLLSSVTGLRVGEILALTKEHLHDNYITVEHSYNRKYGSGPQKTKRGTDQIPIPPMVSKLMHLLAYHDGYIFSFNAGKKPATDTHTLEALKYALDQIGINEEARKERNIVFHSWRVFANTFFISKGISDDKVRDITRHETEEMTEHYTNFNIDDFKEIAEAQKELTEFKNKMGTD